MQRKRYDHDGGAKGRPKAYYAAMQTGERPVKDNRPYIIIVIPPTGEITYSSMPKMPTVTEDINPLVGGIVQIVPYFSKLSIDGKDYSRGTAYCNEEGWLKRLPENVRAHEHWRKACPGGHPDRMHIAGNLVFVVREPKNVAKG